LDTEDSLAVRLPGVFGALTALNESFDAAYTYYIDKVQQRLAMVLNFIDFLVLAGVIIRGAAGFVGLVGMGLRGSTSAGSTPMSTGSSPGGDLLVVRHRHSLILR